jgi:uncharacterized OB-fold protein
LTIEWKKCEKCGFLQHPTHLRCLKCKSQQFLPVRAKGEAKLITYTILTAPPAEFRKNNSYALGVVEFENGIKALGQIEKKGNLVLGMKMKAFKKKICENLDDQEITDYVFKPIE